MGYTGDILINLNVLVLNSIARYNSEFQGFPEEFIIPVSDMQAYKQFGNSVAVPVIRAIANRMHSEMQTFGRQN